MSVDLTSMIDVCFLLIAFFIMVTEVSKAEVVEVFLPFANNAIPMEDSPDDRVIVNVLREGEVVIQNQDLGRVTQSRSRDRIGQVLRAKSHAAGFDENEESLLSVFVRSDAHAQFRNLQALMSIMSHREVRVNKVHYVANNPEDFGG